jgi:hypothetical protein
MRVLFTSGAGYIGSHTVAAQRVTSAARASAAATVLPATLADRRLGAEPTVGQRR